jgi:hypothetical protein
MRTVDPIVGAAGVLFFAAVIAVGVWAGRVHRRQFPRGWDRTGWEPRRGAGGRFRTMFTWLSGGRS